MCVCGGGVAYLKVGATLNQAFTILSYVTLYE